MLFISFAKPTKIQTLVAMLPVSCRRLYFGSTESRDHRNALISGLNLRIQ